MAESHGTIWLASMSDRKEETLHESESELPYGGANGEESPEDDMKFEDIPVVEVHHPKDPRSKAKYNIFSRLLLW